MKGAAGELGRPRPRRARKGFFATTFRSTGSQWAVIGAQGTGTELIPAAGGPHYRGPVRRPLQGAR